MEKSKEITVSVDGEGLLIDGTESTEDAEAIINELADTYCTNPDCLKSMNPNGNPHCEGCGIYSTAFKIRKSMN